MLPPTLFVDIDGTLILWEEDPDALTEGFIVTPTPGSVKKLAEAHIKGCRIILTTGRTESQRHATEVQLRRAGFIWDQLIMGCGAGPRILINDYEKGKPYKAWAENVVRNTGLTDIRIPG